MRSAKVWAGRLAWLGHLLDVQKVAGPNPVRPTTNTYPQKDAFYKIIIKQLPQDYIYFLSRVVKLGAFTGACPRHPLKVKVGPPELMVSRIGYM